MSIRGEEHERREEGILRGDVVEGKRGEGKNSKEEKGRQSERKNNEEDRGRIPLSSGSLTVDNSKTNGESVAIHSGQTKVYSNK